MAGGSFSSSGSHLIILIIKEPMEVDTNSVARVFSADMSVIKPSSSGHLTVKPGSSGSPIRAGMSTPTNGPSQPRRSPRTGGTGGMPPPGQPQARRPWNSRKTGGGLTPQQGARPVKKTLKHSASTSVLPRHQQPAGQQTQSSRLDSQSHSLQKYFIYHH